ncbi:MAG TPA: acyltransferase [Acidocella sp.]|nr:acyltransferase [Acidocella sp.]
MTDSKKPPRLLSLELGRFIAAITVVLSHLLGTLAQGAAPGATSFGGVLAPGPLPVQYFFVLSGFVMVTAHHGDPKGWTRPLKFWWRRVCRIYPVYWAVLLPAVFYTLHGLPPLHKALHLITLNPANYDDVIYPAWTLRYEVAFYLMFGLSLTPYIGRFVLGFWIFSVAWLYFPPAIRWGLWVKGLATLNVYLIATSNHFVNPFELLFFAGLAAGWLFSVCRPSLPAALVALLIGLPLTAYGLYVSQWGYIYPNAFKIPFAAVGYAAVLYAVAVLEALGVFRLGKWAVWLGAMSYPLYISHEPLVFVVARTLQGRHLHEPALYAIGFVALVAIFAAGMFLTFYVDRPAQRFLRRLRLPQLSRYAASRVRRAG